MKQLNAQIKVAHIRTTSILTTSNPIGTVHFSVEAENEQPIDLYL